LKALRPEQDAFGRVLLAYLDGRHRAATVVERDDGFMESESPAAYFDGFRRWFAVERQALRYVRGRVLDVGVGAGRVALELQRRGHPVVAIDVSPLVARVARRRGVRNVKVLALEELDGSLGRFDTVVMFMNNFGLFGSEAKAKRLLRRLHGLTSDRGRIVATSSDFTKNPSPDHRPYRRRNKARGRMPGQIRFRLRYRRHATPWFDYLFVSPRELERLLRGTGWRAGRFIHHEEDNLYAVVIEKEPGAN
jgi:SAM-dependent methyltransferase